MNSHGVLPKKEIPLRIYIVVPSSYKLYSIVHVVALFQCNHYMCATLYGPIVILYKTIGGDE